MANLDQKLDKQIEKLYYVLAAGRQISVLKINALFRDAKTAFKAGTPLEQAVKDAIETHCEPVTP